MKKNSFFLMLYVILSCIFMAYIELIVEPNYLIKSIFKIIVFFVIPFIFIRLLKIKILNHFKVNKKEIIKLLKIGVCVFFMGMISYFVLKNFFDFTKLTRSLLIDQEVTKRQFIFVAIYISFGNSLLEEFMFRFISFIKLKELCNKRFSCIFSAFMFSVYHIGMIAMSFPLPLILLILVGIFILGCLFNFLDDNDNNIYNSWIVHMFCDFAIMLVGFLHL